MLRFLPDGWLEALLRPFLMIDPRSMVYFEEAAPDWRFAAILIFLGIALCARRFPQGLTSAQRVFVLAMFVSLYVWTWVIGNGRYFMASLLMAGPLVVLAVRCLPASGAARGAALVALLGVQVFAISDVYLPNQWGLAKWQQGPGLDVDASPLREQPAIFLTMTGPSYSLLVPRFNPQSRWANIGGQRIIKPTSKEFPRLMSMLRSPLPKYLVMPVKMKFVSADSQPEVGLQEVIKRNIAVYGLVWTGGGCQALHSKLIPRAPTKEPEAVDPVGFLFCPLQSAAHPADVAVEPWPADIEAVFERIEQRCPRFFPPGDGEPGRYESYWMRHYPASDVRLYVEDSGRVLYKYFRALNPTVIGTTAGVRQGTFSIDCGKLPGRYQLPWQRDGNL